MSVTCKIGSLFLVSLIACARSDIGRKRANNEDSYYAHDGLFIVADGMGGHRGGARASMLAVDQASKSFREDRKNGHDIKHALIAAMNDAAIAVYDMGHNEPDLWGMGTTLSMLAIENDRAFITHIGDSRVYKLEDDQLSLLTKDHSLVNEQVQAGMISEDEARISPLRNIITRALGQNKSIVADHYSLNIKSGTVFLLCSDGLTSMVSDEKIAEIIVGNELNNAVEVLIKEANKNGGDDNITIVLLKVLSF